MAEEPKMELLGNQTQNSTGPESHQRWKRASLSRLRHFWLIFFILINQTGGRVWNETGITGIDEDEPAGSARGIEVYDRGAYGQGKGTAEVLECQETGHPETGPTQTSQDQQDQEVGELQSRSCQTLESRAREVRQRYGILEGIDQTSPIGGREDREWDATAGGGRPGHRSHARRWHRTRAKETTPDSTARGREAKDSYGQNAGNDPSLCTGNEVRDPSTRWNDAGSIITSRSKGTQDQRSFGKREGSTKKKDGSSGSSKKEQRTCERTKPEEGLTGFPRLPYPWMIQGDTSMLYRHERIAWEEHCALTQPDPILGRLSIHERRSQCIGCADRLFYLQNSQSDLIGTGLRLLIPHIDRVGAGGSAMECKFTPFDFGSQKGEQDSLHQNDHASSRLCEKCEQYDYHGPWTETGDTQAHHSAHQDIGITPTLTPTFSSTSCHCECTLSISEGPFSDLARSMHLVKTLQRESCREPMTRFLATLQKFSDKGCEAFGELENSFHWTHAEPLYLALIVIFLDVVGITHFFSQHLNVLSIDEWQHLSTEQICEMLRDTRFLLKFGFWKQHFDLDDEMFFRIGVTIGVWIATIASYCILCLASHATRRLQRWWNHRIGRCRFCRGRRTVACRRARPKTKIFVTCFLGWLLVSAEAIEFTSTKNPPPNRNDNRILNPDTENVPCVHECFVGEMDHRYGLLPRRLVDTHRKSPQHHTCLQGFFDTHCIEVSRTCPSADDFCSGLGSRYLAAKRADDSPPQIPITPFSERDMVEPTKADGTCTGTEFDTHSFMQTQQRIGVPPAPCSEICGRHLDPQIYWDRLSIRPAIVQNRFQVWLHDPRAEGLQTDLHQVPWDGTDCICCRFVSNVPIARTSQLQGPFLIRPQPLNRDRTATLNFLALTEPKQAHQRVLHAQTVIDGSLRSGTVLLDTMFGFTTVSALFNIVRPEHRCMTTSWCRVTWRAMTQTFVLWWPTAFAASDYSHLTLEEIEHQRSVPVLTFSGPPASTFRTAATCPDPGSTDYGDSNSLMTLPSSPLIRAANKPISDSDESSLMFVPIRTDRSRSRDRDQEEHSNTANTAEDGETLITEHSSEPSSDDEHSALVVYGKAIEPVLIPIDRDLAPDLYRLVALRHFTVPVASEEGNAFSLHHVLPKPPDLAPCVVPVIAKFHGEHDIMTSLALIDIIMYANSPSTCTESDDPQTFRETWQVPTSATRSVLLHWIGLTELCKQIAYPCIVTYGTHPWHMQDNRPYPLLDGIYLTFRIPVPNPQMPLVFYLEFSRAHIPFGNMLAHWNQQRADVAMRMRRMFETDDEALSAAAQDIDQSYENDVTGLLMIPDLPTELHAPDAALQGEEDTDCSSFMMTPAVGPMQAPHRMSMQSLVIYELGIAPVTVSVDPSLQASQYRHAIGVLSEIEPSTEEWDNFVVLPIRPRPSHLDPLTHDAFLLIMPSQISIGSVHILLRIQLRVVTDCYRREEHSEMQVMTFPQYLDRENFLVNACLYDLCHIDGHDSSDIILAGQPWPRNDGEARYVYSGMYATVRCQTWDSTTSLAEQVRRTRIGQCRYAGAPPPIQASEAMELSLIQTKTMRLHHRSPVTGLPPPGNGPDERADTPNQFEGQLQQEDRISTKWERANQPTLTELLDIPTPMQRRLSHGISLPTPCGPRTNLETLDQVVWKNNTWCIEDWQPKQCRMNPLECGFPFMTLFNLKTPQLSLCLTLHHYMLTSCTFDHNALSQEQKFMQHCLMKIRLPSTCSAKHRAEALDTFVSTLMGPSLPQNLSKERLGLSLSLHRQQKAYTYLVMAMA